MVADAPLGLFLFLCAICDGVFTLEKRSRINAFIMYFVIYIGTSSLARRHWHQNVGSLKKKKILARLLRTSTNHHFIHDGCCATVL